MTWNGPRLGILNSNWTGSEVSSFTFHEANFRKLCTSSSAGLRSLSCAQIPIVRLLTSSRIRRRNAIARSHVQRSCSGHINFNGGENTVVNGGAKGHEESEVRANVYLQARQNLLVSLCFQRAAHSGVQQAGQSSCSTANGSGAQDVSCKGRSGHPREKTSSNIKGVYR